MDKRDERRAEEKNTSLKNQNEVDYGISDYKSLSKHVEKLTEAYERLANAAEKRTYDQDPALGISPLVYPKTDTKSEKQNNST